jgi:hypothetical protein
MREIKELSEILWIIVNLILLCSFSVIPRGTPNELVSLQGGVPPHFGNHYLTHSQAILRWMFLTFC